MAYDPTLVLDMRSMMPFMSGGVQYVRDFSGYGNHGTPVNFAGTDIEYVNTDMGQGVQLDGATKSLSVPYAASLAGIIYSFTAEIWFYDPANTAGVLGLIESRWTGGNDPFRVILNNGILSFQTDSPTLGIVAAQTPAAISRQFLRQVTATFDGVTMALYLDGLFVASGAQNALEVLNAPIDIGRSASVLFFPGVIARARIWTRSMGAAGIYNRYINRFRV